MDIFFLKSFKQLLSHKVYGNIFRVSNNLINYSPCSFYYRSEKTKRRCNTMSKRAKHEILYIIRPDLGDDQKKELVERFDAILTDNGAEITKSEYWDTNRKFAYEI